MSARLPGIFYLDKKAFYTFFSTINPNQVFHNTSFIMAIVDNRMKALHISNKGSYIDTRERFQIFSEYKRKGGGNQINDQHMSVLTKSLASSPSSLLLRKPLASLCTATPVAVQKRTYQQRIYETYIHLRKYQ
jgi:hypothetical protein